MIYSSPGPGRRMLTIIWVNHNSRRIFDLVEESLRSLKDLDHPFYEVVVVDTASSDGSYEAVREYVERIGLRAKILRAENNLGYPGGVNLGFAARDRGSEYVATINQDAVVEPHCFRELVELLSSDERIGAAQGLLLSIDGRRVDAFGGYVDELLRSPRYLWGEPFQGIPRGPRHVSYVDGAVALYRVEALLRVNRRDVVYEPELFLYYEDSLLGLRMWSRGFRSVAAPVLCGRHMRGDAPSPTSRYYSLRNRLALLEISNSRWRGLLPLLRLKLAWAGLPGQADKSLRAVRDSRILASRLRRRGILVDLYKAPLILLSPRDVASYMALGGLARREVLSKPSPYFPQGLGDVK